jgi:hypothetical protein
MIQIIKFILNINNKLMNKHNQIKNKVSLKSMKNKYLNNTKNIKSTIKEFRMFKSY